MSQRISDLTQVSSIAGNELVEISVPNEASPTGYVTRSVSTSLFGGGLPYRFTFELNNQFINSDMSFDIEFRKGDFDSTAFRPNADADPEGNWSLAAAIMNFNAIAAFLYPEGSPPFSKFSPLNSTLWLNWEYDSILRWGTFNSNNDESIYQFGVDPLTNYMNNTPVIAPVNVYENGNYDADGSIVVNFSVISPSNGWSRYPTALSIKGYADINMAFSTLYFPT